MHYYWSCKLHKKVKLNVPLFLFYRYGDKCPKSTTGKLLGSCWIVIGMLFVTMFLGILTTTLMTLLMEGTFDIQHEKVRTLRNY